jgi:hypothetical protein
MVPIHRPYVHQQDGKSTDRVQEVPGIGLQLGRNSLHYFGGSHYAENAGPVQGKSEHPVETGE